MKKLLFIKNKFLIILLLINTGVLISAEKTVNNTENNNVEENNKQDYLEQLRQAAITGDTKSILSLLASKKISLEDFNTKDESDKNIFDYATENKKFKNLQRTLAVINFWGKKQAKQNKSE